MANKTRIHFGGDAAIDPGLVPKNLTKQEFGRRLYQLMLSRGWSQSELARQAGLPRDSISVYVNGRSLPTPTSLKGLADAFGVETTDLLPNHIASAIGESISAMEMKVSPNDHRVAWLTVNRLVSTTTALKIMDLLNADDPVDRSGSGAAA